MLTSSAAAPACPTTPAARLARAAFAHTAAYDAAIVGWFDSGGAGGERRAAARPRCTSPSSAPRSCATARTPISSVPATGSPANRRGGTPWSSTPARRCRISTSSTPTPPGAWSTSWRGAPLLRPWPSSSTPTRVAPPWPAPWPRPTPRRSSAIRCPPSAVWWPWGVPVRRPWPGRSRPDPRPTSSWPRPGRPRRSRSWWPGARPPGCSRPRPMPVPPWRCGAWAVATSCRTPTAP